MATTRRERRRKKSQNVRKDKKRRVHARTARLRATAAKTREAEPKQENENKARGESAVTAPSPGPAALLFEKLAKLARGRPSDLRSEIIQLKEWFTVKRERRPSGYMNLPRMQAAYLAYHLPLHLPEMHWILSRLPELGRPRNESTNGSETEKTSARPLRILDYGSGPATASLAWLLARPDVPVARWTLADISSRTLENGEALMKSLRPDLPLETRKLPEGWKRVPWRESYDHVILSHVLNEMGSGPRIRERKSDFLFSLLDEALDEDGLIWIVEPPLREPTMDLMWLRDELVERGFEVLAPCPRGVERCPMAARGLGWCYAQPPRAEASAAGLAPWDREIERSLDRRLDKLGFSYLVARKLGPAGESTRVSESPRVIAITDAEAWQRWLCTEDGLKQTEARPRHRGEWSGPRENQRPRKPPRTP